MKLKHMIQNIGTFSQVGFASEVCKLLVSSGQWGSSKDVDTERSYAELWVSLISEFTFCLSLILKCKRCLLGALNLLIVEPWGRQPHASKSVNPG